MLVGAQDQVYTARTDGGKHLASIDYRAVVPVPVPGTGNRW